MSTFDPPPGGGSQQPPEAPPPQPPPAAPPPHYQPPPGPQQLPPGGWQQPASPGQPQPGYGAPQYGHVPPGQPRYRYAEESQATTAVIVAIFSVMFCQLLSPVAWYLGSKELNAIDAGRRDPANRTEAKVAQILGILGSVLIGIALASLLLLFVMFLAGVAAVT